MQWLFNIIEEKMEAAGFLKTGYVARGDHSTYDFLIGDFTIDNQWYDLDLSGIVPANAQAVHLHFIGQSNTIEVVARLRAKYETYTKARCVLRPQVAGIRTDGLLNYQITVGDWTDLKLTVRGWWL
jgi:uncharacterized protein YutD